MALKRQQPIRREIKKSARRMPLQEFVGSRSLRPEVAAGFRAWLNGDLHHSEEDWEALFEEYTNRTL